MEVLRSWRQFPLASSILLPRHRRVVVRHFPHGNASLHGAHRRAEIASHARLFDDLDHRSPPVAAWQPPDRLMCAVLTRGPAQLALDARILIDVREQMIVE